MDTAIVVGLIIGLGGSVISLFKKSPVSSSKLMKAAEKDDLKRFKKILKKRRAKVNDYGMSGNRPLHVAAGKWAKEGLLEDILARGAVIDVRNIYKQSPLHLAAEKGNLDAIRILLENGADVNARDLYLRTPLDMAESKKRKRPIELLKSYGAEESDH